MLTFPPSPPKSDMLDTGTRFLLFVLFCVFLGVGRGGDREVPVERSTELSAPETLTTTSIFCRMLHSPSGPTADLPGLLSDFDNGLWFTC